MTATETLEKPPQDPREQELQEIERILREGTPRDYKNIRERCQFLKSRADLERKHPILPVFEKIYQNELAGKKDTHDGLSPAEKGLLEPRLPR